MASTLDDLFRRRVLFVNGKGGVGKSTMAAALALQAAERGNRTLLIDVENKGDASRFLDSYPPRYQPKQALRNLWHLGLEPDDVLEEYLRVALKVPRFYRMGPLSKVFDFIATAAPGVREVLIAGKVGFEERARADGGPRWDVIVVDAAPAGQVLSHLRGPRTLQEMVGVGMIRTQTEWVRKIIEDPAKTCLVVVALPEEMPTTETAELLEQAPKAVDTPVLAIIANRVVPPPPDQQAFEAVRTALGEGPAVEAADLFAAMAANQAPFLERLRELGPPVLEVPFLPLGRHDLSTSRTVAEALRAEALRAEEPVA
jgi:anion-transporting  ArsA/GET3 family ATPase